MRYRTTHDGWHYPHPAIPLRNTWPYGALLIPYGAGLAGSSGERT